MLKQTRRLRGAFCECDHLLLLDLALKETFTQVDEAWFSPHQNRPDRGCRRWRRRVKLDIAAEKACDRTREQTGDLYPELRNARFKPLIRGSVGRVRTEGLFDVLGLCSSGPHKPDRGKEGILLESHAV